MNTEVPILHVVFSVSAAEELRAALRKAMRADEVTAFPDNLSYGPIDPLDSELRNRWKLTELQYGIEDPSAAEIEAFWSTATTSRLPRVAWVSRRSASDYCGFLEWLWRVGEDEIEIVDLTDVQLVNHRGVLIPPQPLSIIPSDTIIRNALWDFAQAITPLDRERYRKLWQGLKSGNAPLRVLGDGELASAPISYFDQLLISCATKEWRKAMYTVGYALADFLDTGYYNTTDVVLSARIRALVQYGALELRGDPIELRNAEVRLPPTEAY